MKQLRHIEKIIVGGIVALLIIVITTGIWVYIRLSEVANRPVDSDKNNVRITILKELNNNLLLAENYTYTYLFRNENEIVQQFYIIRTKTDFKIAQLGTLKSPDPEYKNQIENIKKYVNKRFENLQLLMRIQNENRVDETMSLVVNEMKSAAKSGKTTQTITIPSEKKGLFQRKKTETKQIEYSTLDNSRSINSTLQSIKENVVSEEQLNNVRKLEIEKENNLLSDRITQISNKIADRDKARVLAENEKTKAVAAETNEVILLFSIFTALFLLVVFYMFLLSFRRTNSANRELKLAKEKSDQLTDAKSRFLATMSHEIRTPLHAILGFSENLVQAKLKNSDHEMAVYILKSATHLTQITNEILDLSKLNNGAIAFEEVHFDPKKEIELVVTTLAESWKTNNNQFTRRINTKIGTDYLGDPLRFRQILINLLNNAAKFTQNGKITLTVDLLDKNDQFGLKIIVKDTGIGIAEQDIFRVFNEFEQAEKSTTRNFGGTGLGLPITKKLIELQGGTIEVESELGIGSSFIVQLPLKVQTVVAASDSHLNKNKDQATHDFNKKKVLIVDDEPFNRKLLAQILNKTNMELSEANNGLEAIEKVEAGNFDLILMDLRMPEMDGFQAKLELEKRSIHTPVVALTATLTIEEQQDLLEKGWAGVLIKPYQAEDLTDLIAQIFKTNTPI